MYLFLPDFRTYACDHAEYKSGIWVGYFQNVCVGIWIMFNIAFKLSKEI